MTLEQCYEPLNITSVQEVAIGIYPELELHRGVVEEIGEMSH